MKRCMDFLPVGLSPWSPVFFHILCNCEEPRKAMAEWRSWGNQESMTVCDLEGTAKWMEKDLEKR